MTVVRVRSTFYSIFTLLKLQLCVKYITRTLVGMSATTSYELDAKN